MKYTLGIYSFCVVIIIIIITDGVTFIILHQNIVFTVSIFCIFVIIYVIINRNNKRNIMLRTKLLGFLCLIFLFVNYNKTNIQKRYSSSRNVMRFNHFYKNILAKFSFFFFLQTTCLYKNKLRSVIKCNA